MNATEALAALNAIQALLGWLGGRGITRAHAQTLLDTATAENRDLTIEEVQTDLDLLASELDETADLINRD